MNNSYNQEITIPFSKGKIFLFLLLCAAIMALCLWDLYTGGHPKRWNPAMWKILTSIIIVFSFLGFVLLFIKLFDKRPGLVIDEEGFVNNTPYKSQRILWKNVTGFDVWKHKGSKLILIYVNNSEEIIANSNRLSRFNLRSNMRMVGTPVNVGSSILKIKFNELLDIMKKYHSTFSASDRNPQWFNSSDFIQR